MLVGQQQGDLMHKKMGAYEFLGGKQVNGRGVWQLAGGQDCFMYYSWNKKWFISRRASMKAGAPAGWMCVSSTAITPDQITETWLVADGKDKWPEAPNMMVRACSADEKRGAVEALEQLQQHAMAAAWTSRYIRVGREEDGNRVKYCNHFIRIFNKKWHDKTGVYELVEGKEVNGHGVWQMAGGQEYFIYYASTQWFIGGRNSMVLGKAVGWLSVASTALTPNQITETWRAWVGCAGWVETPKLTVRVCSEEEKHGVVEGLEQDRQHALTAATGTGDICVEGQVLGDLKQVLMGVYELVEGKEVNGRGVWQMAGGKEYFLYYASKQWIMSHRASMEAGKASGWLSVASTALTPDQITETWQVADGNGKWPEAPKVRAHVYSAAEKRAAEEMQQQQVMSAMAGGEHMHDLVGVHERPMGVIDGGSVGHQWQDEHGGGGVPPPPPPPPYSPPALELARPPLFVPEYSQCESGDWESLPPNWMDNALIPTSQIGWMDNALIST
jgi:hypothetical protein